MLRVQLLVLNCIGDSTTYCYAHDECDALRFIKNVDENIRYELFSGPRMHTDTDKMHVRICEHLGQTMVPTTADSANSISRNDASELQ